MFNNLGQAFKTYLIIVNDRIRNNKQLDENEKLFKAIQKEKTWIISERKASVHLVTTKSYHLKLQKKDTKDQVEWRLSKKCACNHPSDFVPLVQ